MKYQGQRGFTLIELIVVIGVLSIILTITLIAINPGRLLANARNTRRRNDITAIAHAIEDTTIANSGTVPVGITNIPTPICNNIGTGVSCAAGTVDLYSSLQSGSLSSIPKDPASASDSNTLYYVYLTSSNCVSVVAPKAELDQDVYADCEPDVGLSLDGQTGYVDVPVADGVAGLTQATVEAWVKVKPLSPPPSTVGTIYSEVAWAQSNEARRIVLEYNFDQYRIISRFADTTKENARTEYYHETALSGPLTGWNHIAMVTDSVADKARLYLNGIQIDSWNVAGLGAYKSTAPIAINIGKTHVAGQDYYFPGGIDEVRVSNIARYSSNFTPDYKFATDANTVSLWHLDEKTGTTTTDASHGYVANKINVPGWMYHF